MTVFWRVACCIILSFALLFSFSSATAALPPTEPGPAFIWGEYLAGNNQLQDFEKIFTYNLTTIGIRPDGSLAGWGSNEYGQCLAPLPNENFKTCTLGDGFVVAMKNDGTLVAWGNNEYGQCDIPASAQDLVEISAGDGHVLGLKPDGSIIAWGNNTYGQCEIPGPNSGFQAVAAGMLHSLALRVDGSLVHWGHNLWNHDQLPIPNSGFQSIDAVGYSNGAVKTDGSLRVWGYDFNDLQYLPTPNAGFESLHFGTYHAVGIKEGGTAVTWGDNSIGQGTVPIPSTRYSDVHPSFSCTYAKILDGPWEVWGPPQSIPSPNDNFVSIKSSFQMMAGLTADQELHCFGYQYLGDYSFPQHQTGIVRFDLNQQVLLTLDTTGFIQGFGNNNSGALNVPNPNEDFIDVATNGLLSMGIKSDGNLVTWGTTEDGPWILPEPNGGFVAIEAGYNGLALHQDGSVVAITTEANPITYELPEPNTGFVDIAVCGTSFKPMFALHEDGHIAVWGPDNPGLYAIPEPNTDFISVAAGDSHALGLKSDGTVVVWGEMSEFSGLSSTFSGISAGGGWCMGISPGGVLSIDDNEPESQDLPPSHEMSLQQNIPNPFNPLTRINFELDQKGPVLLAVYDLHGRIVRKLENRFLEAGRHQVWWDGRNDAGRNMPSGTYLYRLETPSRIDSKRMTLIR